MAFIFFLTSCSLLKGPQKLEGQDREKLLDSIQMIGEGRGRLSLGLNQYVFSYDSILKDNNDWILAVTIPLQGEEAMILQDLKQKEMKNAEMESFEARIQQEFKKIKLDKVLSPEEFLVHLRSLIRFGLAKNLELKRHCSQQHEEYICTLDGEKFLVAMTEKDFDVTKMLGDGRRVVLEGRNLTESVFSQTNIRLFSNQAEVRKKNSAFALELFWK